MHELTSLMKEDMRPALGVTEPGAIAFAVATARNYAQGNIVNVRVALNSGMYKNAFTCGIPNTDQVGNVFAAALGAIAGDADLGLEALAHVKECDNELARKLVWEGKIEVVMDHIGSEINIKATVETEKDVCEVHIAGSHTNIVSIVKNQEVLFEEEYRQEKRDPVSRIHQFTLEDILMYVQNVEIGEIAFIKDAFAMNMELFEAGMESQKTTFVHQLYKENGKQLFSKDELKTAQLLCNGAIEARVLGIEKPAMSITGSGAHGIIATLPLFAYSRIHEETIAKEQLLRATALSYLVTMYIKEYSGKLSAFCGCGIAAGTGMACGLGFLRGAGRKELAYIIQNMASSITGMICDGGNQGCVMKGIVATDAAFRSVDMAMEGIHIERIHGINGNTPESTMKNMGSIASPGMVQTENTIIEIMQQKGEQDA